MEKSNLEMSRDPHDIAGIIRDMYLAQIRTADKMNADAAANFWRDYNDAKLNWSEKGMKFPYAGPRLLAKVQAKLEMPDPSVTITLGPELCVDPVPQAPWDIPVPPPVEPLPGALWFHDIGAGPDLYAGGGAGVLPGDIRVNPANGLRYVHVVTGFPGSINYFRGWRLVP